MLNNNRLKPPWLCQKSLENTSPGSGCGPVTRTPLRATAGPLESGTWLPAPARGCAVRLQTRLINDLVSLSCKKTGNVFQGRKFSQTFKHFQCFVKAKASRSPLGLAGVMDVRGDAEELFQASPKRAHYNPMGCGRFLSPK